MTDRLLDVYLDSDLTSKTAVYDFLATSLTQQGLDYQASLTALDYRESLGNIQIADQVVLPHLEHLGDWQGVIIVRTKKVIPRWSEKIKDISLIILLVIAKDGDLDQKRTIQQFVRGLVKEDMLDVLLHENQVDTILEKVSKGAS